MRYKAIIFDLYGTLVDNFSMEEHEKVATRMAKILGAPPEEFVRLWFESYDWRAVGKISAPEDNIRYICDRLGITAEESAVQEAARVRYEFIRNGLKPDSEAIPVILKLKSMGYKVGLISDCSAETPASWDTSPLSHLMNAAIFSCLVGFKKPEPHIYLRAAEQLGVEPMQCLYIGDGASQELSGAASVGMQPVMITNAAEPLDAHGVHEEWTGRKISSLDQVPDIMSVQQENQEDISEVWGGT